MEDLSTDTGESVIKYMLKHINSSAMNDKYTVASILMFRGYGLRQNGNGAYIDITSVDRTTIRDIYQFMTYKLVWFNLCEQMFTL